MQSASYSSDNIDSLSRTESLQRSFIILLLVVTAMPFLAGPLLRSVYASSAISQQLFTAVLLIGGSHQIASMYLYFDADAKPIIDQHKGYFYLAPVIIALSCAAIYVVDIKWVENYFLTAYAMLTIFHYQKQNIGVYSLLAPVLGSGKMMPIERFLIMGGALAGMLVFAWPIERTLFQGTFLFPFEAGLNLFSLLLLCALTLFTVGFVVKNYLWVARKQRQYFRGLLLFALVSFFWPMFLLESKLTAFFMYASAHGLQYFVFIAYSSVNGAKVRRLLATDRSKGILLQRFNLVTFSVLTVLLAYLWKELGAANPSAALMLTESEMKKAFFGLSSSITLIHFWVDSRIWKMRYDDSRAFVRSKFDFLF